MLLGYFVQFNNQQNLLLLCGVGELSNVHTMPKGTHTSLPLFTDLLQENNKHFCRLIMSFLEYECNH